MFDDTNDNSVLQSYNFIEVFLPFNSHLDTYNKLLKYDVLYRKLVDRLITSCYCFVFITCKIKKTQRLLLPIEYTVIEVEEHIYVCKRTSPF